MKGRWTAISIGVVVLLFAIFGFIMWKAGLLTYTGTADSAKILVGALALVGALIGASVSIIGLLLKHSIDQRSEKRMQLEAAIQAVQLLSTGSGELAHEVQRAGALFTLTALGRYELAANLAWQMLIKGKLDPASFTSVINQVLIGGNQHEKEDAAAMLYYHPQELFLPNGLFTFPDCFMRWDMNLPKYVRRLGAQTLGRLVTKLPRSKWRKGEANMIIGALALGWCQESDNELKNDVGAILKKMVRFFDQEDDLIHFQCRIDMPKICSEIASVEAISSGTKNVIRELEAWAANQTQGE